MEKDIIKYLKEMQGKHEAFYNYGLCLNYDLTVELNKEVLIRQITTMERLIVNKMHEMLGNHNFIDLESPISEEERQFALCKILVLIDAGLIDKYKFTLIKPSEVLV